MRFRGRVVCLAITGTCRAVARSIELHGWGTGDGPPPTRDEMAVTVVGTGAAASTWSRNNCCSAGLGGYDSSEEGWGPVARDWTGNEGL